MHEDLERDPQVEQSSDRSFGLIFAAVGLGLGALSLYRGNPWGYALLAAAAVMGSLALLAPQVLGPANRLWLRFGALLSRVTTPVVMGFVFFVLLTPVAILRRMLGGDPLHRKRDATARSYWTPRDPPPSSMRNQF